MNLASIRNAFLDYFKQHDHTIVTSSPLVPGNDPTLLFTNAGMVQFKDVFLGNDKRAYTRAASSQCCIRAGGKHNDLENVGYTARHHTFFEMLGNFSFGDYFKRDAIQFAWTFLTDVLNIPAEKLWVTVYTEDDEAADIWLNELKVSPERFSRCGEKDNFWSMGDTGPCGPCSEIFYDHGESIPGGPPGSPDDDLDRYVEIWNLVFMQYDRSQDGTLTPLPKPSVDTGMGLERIAAVMQGVHNNYDIDLFQQLITAIADITKTQDKNNTSLKVIADHIRSTAFLIAEGVMPSNEGRGYVLRRIIRRAVRHGNKLGVSEPFFYRIVAALVDAMGEAYPELRETQDIMEKVLRQEEEQFAKTLEQGLRILEQDIADMSGKEIPGDTVFKLYDTYGFPVDLTADIARERALSLDMAGFDAAMQVQREKSQAASQFAAVYDKQVELDVSTEFTGYDRLEDSAKIVKMLHNGKACEQLAAGESGLLILDRSPFYPEGGGQVGDMGRIQVGDAVFVVEDTQKQGDAILHLGHVESGEITASEEAKAIVDHSARRATVLNHSATHLLHAALRECLGSHVQQKGSLVDPERLRFDFTHFEAIDAKMLTQVERLVNQKIRENLAGEVALMTPEAAQQSGAMALFGEKYGETVRVLSFGEFSKELCGGTHVQRTGDIGCFKITTESGIAAGIRRIEAITGEKAMQYFASLEQQLDEVANAVKGHRDTAVEKVAQTVRRQRDLEKEIEQLKAKLASAKGSDLLDQAEDVAGVKVLAVKLEGVEPKSLRGTLDQLKNKLGSSVVVLVGVNDDRINVVAGISKDNIGKVPAPKDLVALICGKGGGRDDMAQGGGVLPADLDQRLSAITELVKKAM